MCLKNSVRFLAVLLLLSCTGNAQEETKNKPVDTAVKPEILLKTGAQQTERYLGLIEGNTIAIVANQTSVIGQTHLVDSLLSLGVDVSHVYAPEHGFRGDQDAGAHISDEKDSKTGLPIYSLHGSSKKPSAESLNGVDILLFDIQDVGARFYTYISSLHYVMEACAEQGVELIVLDRPNPNGHFIDGPLLEPAFSSFIGMHPVPVVHGMTIGEYAQMINGQGWLKNGVEALLSVIPCEGYTHNTPYDLPVAPSPNLPNQTSIYLYPSLCFFEGTELSIGRGTDYPFQLIGHPLVTKGSYSFTPESNYGSKYPKLKGELCRGQLFDAQQADKMYQSAQLDVSLLLDYYELMKDKSDFFNKDGFFEKLSGTELFKAQIIAGKSEAEIRESWKKDLDAYRLMSAAYKLYP